jgi:hypothetical protein
MKARAGTLIYYLINKNRVLELRGNEKSILETN